jgi:hypothetical protein
MMTGEGIDPLVLQKMALKLAQMEVRNSILEVALESAQRELASLRGDGPEDGGN